MPAQRPLDAPQEMNQTETKRRFSLRLLPFHFSKGADPEDPADAPEGDKQPKIPCEECRRRPTPTFSCLRPVPGDAPPAGGDYKNQNLRGWKLVERNFGKADLQGCSLQDADLTRSDLSQVVNLLPEQLSGANLRGAKLPQNVAAFEALAHVKELSENAGKLLVSLLAACAFMLLTVDSMTDAQILIGSGTTKLPLVDTEVSVKLFFLFGPLIILGLYFAFHLYLQRLWETMATLPAVFPDGVTLDRKSCPWLVNDLVRLYFIHLKEAPMRTPLMFFQEKLWQGIVYWLAPVLLLSFWARSLFCRDWRVTGLHILVVAVGVWSALLFRYLARITLERDQTKVCAWQNRWAQGARAALRGFVQGMRVPGLGRSLAYKTSLAVLGLVFFSAAVFGGYPPDAPVSGDLWDAARLRARQAAPWLLSVTNASAFARLQDLRPPTPHGGAGDSTTADLRGQDLRYTRAEGVNLSGADLRGANLQHASLQDSDLTDANLEGADLQWADLDYANHRKARYWFLALYDDKQCLLLGLPPGHNALMKEHIKQQGDYASRDHMRDWKLDGYNLVSSPLKRVSLRYATLEGANLQHTDLHDADLRYADLSGAQFLGADLSNAQLMGARLAGADLQGAHLETALVTDKGGATDIKRIYTAKNWILAHYNPQQLSDLQLANDHEARLKSSNFSGLILTRMNLRDCNLIRFHLEGATLYQTDLRGAHLKAAFLNKAKAREVRLDGADLRLADLSGAHLEGAHLEGAHLEAISPEVTLLKGTHLEGAHLEGANLKGTDLTGANLAGAYYDSNTQWPFTNFPAKHPEMHKVGTALR